MRRREPGRFARVPGSAPRRGPSRNEADGSPCLGLFQDCFSSSGSVFLDKFSGRLVSLCKGSRWDLKGSRVELAGALGTRVLPGPSLPVRGRGLRVSPLVPICAFPQRGTFQRLRPAPVLLELRLSVAFSCAVVNDTGFDFGVPAFIAGSRDHGDVSPASVLLAETSPSAPDGAGGFLQTTRGFPSIASHVAGRDEGPSFLLGGLRASGCLPTRR